MRDSPYYVRAENPKRGYPTLFFFTFWMGLTLVVIILFWSADVQKYVDKYMQGRSQKIDVIKAVPSSIFFYPLLPSVPSWTGLKIPFFFSHSQAPTFSLRSCSSPS